MESKAKKLSVAFLYDDSLDSDNGVSQSVKILGSWLSSQGHTVSYFAGETKLSYWQGGKVYSLSKNIGITFNHNRLSMPLMSHRRDIRRALAEAQPDIIHVTMPHSPFMAQRVINTYEGPVVGAFHILPSGWLSSFGTRMLREIYGRSLKRIVNIAATSPAAAKFSEQSLGVKTGVIPNPVDIKKFKVEKTYTASKPKIVFLGRLVKRKGPTELIKAFSLIATQFPTLKLILAGDGPDRKKLERLVAKLGVAERVEFSGYIDEKDKPKLLASANIACFPSLYGESFGIVLVEAMAAGSGVVLGGDNPGYRSVLSELPKTLVDPADSQSFAARLAEFLSDTQLSSKTHAKQQEMVKQYDVNVVGQQWLALYDQAIAKRRQRLHN